jgi:phasin family protein
MSTQTKTTKSAPKPAAAAAAAPAVAAEETVEQAIEAATGQVEKATAAVTQGYGDFAALQKDAFDALVRSGEILAKGAEALGKEYFAFAQKAAEANNEAAKAMMAATSVTEFVQLQSDFFRINLDKSVDESSKLSEMSLKIASEAFEPLQKQMTAAVEAGMKPLAV